ncbi:MAG: hypothetical protein JKY37_02260 [Nannocystaceae bacterium]|nr:hypothetical protein [Nannocystaceae bacterium]
MNRAQVGVGLAALSLSCAGGGAKKDPFGVATFADSSGGDDDAQSSLTTSDGGATPETSASEGDADTTSGDADSSSGGIPDDPPDLSDGQWQFENVSTTPGISLHGRRAMLDDGREIVAWAQADPQQISTLNIMAAQGPDGWTIANITAISGAQNTFPSLAGGNRALLAWAGQGSSGDDYDIYLVRSQGNAWSPPENLSDMFEDNAKPLTDTKPVILRRTDGGVAIVYMATTPAGKFEPPGTPEIFVTKFFEDNSPSQRSPLSPSGASCSALAGATAPSGVFHVVLACVDDGSSVLIHATDRSGEWDTDELNGVTSGVLSPSMAAGIDGSHIVWIQNVPCGAENCSEVFHMATDSEEVFGTPVQITNTANRNERQPAVGVDPWGRVFVASQARIDSTARLYLSVADDGEVFGDPERVSPDSVDDYQTPTGFAFDAAGNPSFITEVVVDGSDPLNIEIYVARFVPN